MKNTSVSKRNAYLVIGSAGLFLSLGYLGKSFQLPFGGLHQPGAAIFPVFVGVILMLASLATIWEGWKLEKAERIDVPVGIDRRRLLSLTGLLLGFFLALPWLGQTISSTLFCILLMRVLSDLSWPRIVVYSLPITTAIYLIFVSVLKVPMPRGILGF